MHRTCIRLDSAMFFFFNDTATTEIYTLSLHDALPISMAHAAALRALQALPAEAENQSERLHARHQWNERRRFLRMGQRDRKSTRLNSSHSQISYAVFCLKKKNND